MTTPCPFPATWAPVARYLSYVRAKPGYLNAKDSVEAALCRVPKVGEHMAAEVRRVKNQIKKNIFNTTIFQDLGFNYYGPFDGHDLRTLTSVFDDGARYG